ncbi:hypothetical protein [Flavihumibacter solisilvae]|uniref:Uncharacterized protein n=1 Tax=Flavihumibacter solisilvae TaxID=1349421 RepID=A0A0C1L463_9BACT|nr:hypothetical protein [Flavihumibacter solisilvae]KIC94872.1 hypothetical protein OI18_08105 [Flavihumibacter solisilvae]
MNARKYSISGIEFLIELFHDADPEFIYKGTLLRVGDQVNSIAQEFKFAGASPKHLAITPLFPVLEQLAIMTAIEDFEKGKY